MKWSELFANILGEKDTEVSTTSGNIGATTQEHSQVTTLAGNTQEQVESTNVQLPVQVSNSMQTQSAPNLTQEQFDALNRKIAELEAANRELLLNGASQDQTPEATPESLIYSLCVERNGHGKQNTTNSSNTAEC